MSEQLHVMAEAVRRAYAAGEEDEALLPRVLVDRANRAVGRIHDGDVVIFYDLRGEREVELTRAFVEPGFPHFPTGGLRARFTTMIEYHSSLPVAVAFPPEVRLRRTLGEVLSEAGRQVVKVSESEKAIHLAYFFNGRREEPFAGERRLVVESPGGDYATRPEMAAAEVCERAIVELGGEVELLIVNFANVDVVGHIENETAVLRAVETVDRELGRLLAAAEERGVPAIVTADHGTVEKWLYPDGNVDTGHTDSPVPFILFDRRLKGFPLRSGGSLTDVAPTILRLLGLSPPSEMTGTTLLARQPGLSPPLLLVICDGWGWREAEEGNLIKKARTPVMDRLAAEYPFTTLAAAGEAVGMPPGKVGNSEAGHLHLGAGRKVLSDRLRIDRAIADGSFRQNPALLAAMDIARRENRPLHLLGIVSFYSSHGSVDHLYELLSLAREQGLQQVYHHALLGRRGERPEAGARYIDDVEAFCKKLGVGRVVTVMGRFWALDREQNWDRVEKAYRALAAGEGEKVRDERL